MQTLARSHDPQFVQVTAPAIHRPCARRPRATSGSAGFTLIETMVALGITAVLSSVAYPSFEAQLLRARRSDALTTLMMVQLAEERWRANARSYGTLAEIGSAGVSSARHYTVQVTAISEQGYDLLATATGVQARDATCRHLKLSVIGDNASHASGPDPSVANPDAINRKCWML